MPSFIQWRLFVENYEPKCNKKSKHHQYKINCLDLQQVKRKKGEHSGAHDGKTGTPAAYDRYREVRIDHSLENCIQSRRTPVRRNCSRSREKQEKARRKTGREPFQASCVRRTRHRMLSLPLLPSTTLVFGSSCGILGSSRARMEGIFC